MVVANSEGPHTTPSVVAFAKNGEVLLGQAAKNQAVTNVDRTVRPVKPLGEAIYAAQTAQQGGTAGRGDGAGAAAGASGDGQGAGDVADAEVGGVTRERH